MSVFSGTSATHYFRLEDTFDASDPTNDAHSLNTDYVWGRNTTIDSVDASNNGTEMFELGNHLATDVVPGSFDGEFSVSFTLASWEFLRVFDSDGAFGTTAFDFGNPQSFEMVVARPGANPARLFTGCIATSMELDSQLDGTVEVSVSGQYANEYKVADGDTYSINTQPSENTKAFHFANVTLDPNSTNDVTIALPRGITLSVDQNTALVDVLGQRTPDDFVSGTVNVSLDITHAVKNDETDSLEAMYGAASGVDPCPTSDNTFEIQYQNCDSTNPSDATITLDAFIDTYGESGLDPTEDLVEADITGIVSSTFEIDVTSGGDQTV